MAPDAVNWALFFALFLVVVWVGFLIMALNWILNNAAVLFGALAAVVLLVFVVHEAKRTSG